MRTYSVSGKLSNGAIPVAGALIRFVADLATLGSVPQAAVVMRSAVAWSHRLTGFRGNRWQAYRKYVGNQVAGLSFAEFKVLVVAKNPSLDKTGLLFQPELVYRMPHNDVASAVALTWDRHLTGFAGNRWQCWQALVAHKVIGITWAQFRREVMERNPALAADGGIFHAGQRYCLPRNPNLPELEIVATTDAAGRYRISSLPAGEYRVEVTVNGTLHSTLTLHVAGDLVQDISLRSPAMLAADDDGFIRTEGTQFRRGDAPFRRFVGVNITGLLHYGETYVDESGHTKKVIEHSATTDRRRALEEAREIGARVIRVFLPHYSCPKEEVARRLTRVLADMKAVGDNMYLLPVFIDLYHNRGSFPHPKQEVDDRFYAQQGAKRRLVPAFFVPPYCQPYLDLVDHVVTAFRNEPRIFAWEIGNELKLDPDKTPGIGRKEFVAFNHFMAQRIKQIDPNHLVTTGMKSTQHPDMLHHRDLAERLYGDRLAGGRRLIDFVTIHSYVDPEELAVEKQGFEADARLAKALGMPLVVEETGVSHKFNDCRGGLEKHMKRWFDIDAESDQQRAYGFMEWGFCPQGIADGSNDNCNDRTIIREIYRRRSDMLAVV